jgi:hypothetical protein
MRYAPLLCEATNPPEKPTAHLNRSQRSYFRGEANMSLWKERLFSTGLAKVGNHGKEESLFSTRVIVSPFRLREKKSISSD